MAALASMCVSAAAVASAAETGPEPPAVSVDMTVATDYVFRGISQTLSRPALQLGTSLEFANGIYVYAWASNVDFAKSTDPDDGARWELDLAAAYAADISEYLSVDLSWVHYRFPGTTVDIDYDEWIASLYVLDNYRLTAGYSDDVFGSAAGAPFYEAGVQLELSGDLYLSLEGGYYDLERPYLDSYSYASVTVGRHQDGFGWKLAYHRTGSGAANLFYPSVAEPRLVASLQFEF